MIENFIKPYKNFQLNNILTNDLEFYPCLNCEYINTRINNFSKYSEFVCTERPLEKIDLKGCYKYTVKKGV